MTATPHAPTRPEVSARPDAGWVQAQSQRAADELRSIDGWQQLVDRVRTLDTLGSAPLPVLRAGRWFRPDLDPITGEPAIVVSEEPYGEPVHVLRGSSILPDSSYELDSWEVSPDGSRIAVTMGVVGTKLHRLVVLDLATAEVIDDSAPQVQVLQPAWLSDSRTVVFSAADPDARPLGWKIFRHTIGTPPPSAPEPLEINLPVALPQSSADGSVVGVIVDHLNPRPHYVLEDGQWRVFLRDTDGVFEGAFIGRDYVAITDHAAPMGQVVRIPLDAGADESRWTVLVPESEAYLRDLTPIGSRLVISEIVGGSSRLRVVSLDGAEPIAVELPTPGRIGTAMGASTAVVPAGEHHALFWHTTLTTSPRLLRCDLRDGSLEELTSPEHTLPFAVQTYNARSADGTLVPYHVVSLPGSDEPRPAFVHGYGGFNLSFQPDFIGAYATLVEAGAHYVHAHLRGGGEFGRSWWEGGRRDTKQNTFDDMTAIVEDLVARGLAVPDRVAITGASNGGVMAGAVLTQHPELLRAAVVRVPILDMLGLVDDPLTLAAVANEYGDPRVPVEAEWLSAYSPLQHVTDGVRYPAVLFQAGEDDQHAPQWHAATMAERVASATASEHRVLLRIWDGIGHGSATDPTERAALEAEILAFVITELGLTVGGATH